MGYVHLPVSDMLLAESHVGDAVLAEENAPEEAKDYTQASCSRYPELRTNALCYSLDCAGHQ